MITAGIDIGSVTTKVVIFDTENQKIISKSISPTGANPKKIAEEVLDEALSKAKLLRKNLNYIVSTGYGRRIFEFGDKTVTEISCCAKGALWYCWMNNLSTPRTIIDLGGQDTKIISLDEDGNIIDFVMNDKCAAGTGRFLEVMSSILEVNLDDLGKLALKSEKPIKINSTCTVFIETEVISLIAQGRSKEDIIAGIHNSIAERIAGMLTQVSTRGSVFFCGGGAKNIGICKAIESRISEKLFVPDEPQFIIALGAALMK